MTFLLGGAAAVTILSALFLLANNYIMNKIGFMMSEKLNKFKDELTSSLKEDYITRKEVDVMQMMHNMQSSYVSRSEIEMMRKSAEDVHKRQDDELNRIWELAKSAASGNKGNG